MYVQGIQQGYLVRVHDMYVTIRVYACIDDLDNFSFIESFQSSETMYTFTSSFYRGEN